MELVGNIILDAASKPEADLIEIAHSHMASWLEGLRDFYRRSAEYAEECDKVNAAREAERLRKN
jgi:hypothetical protein